MIDVLVQKLGRMQILVYFKAEGSIICSVCMSVCVHTQQTVTE